MELNKEQLDALEKSANIMKQLLADAYSKFHAAQQAHSLTAKQSEQKVAAAPMLESWEAAYVRVLNEKLEVEKRWKQTRELAEQQSKEAGERYGVLYAANASLERELQCARGDIKQGKQNNDALFGKLSNERDLHNSTKIERDNLRAEVNKLQILLAGGDLDRAADKAHIRELQNSNSVLEKQIIDAKCKYGNLAMENVDLSFKNKELSAKLANVGAGDGNVV